MHCMFLCMSFCMPKALGGVRYAEVAVDDALCTGAAGGDALSATGTGGHALNAVGTGGYAP